MGNDPLTKEPCAHQWAYESFAGQMQHAKCIKCGDTGQLDKLELRPSNERLPEAIERVKAWRHFRERGTVIHETTEAADAVVLLAEVERLQSELADNREGTAALDKALTLRLQAVARERDLLRAALERAKSVCVAHNDGKTHYAGCELKHPLCRIFDIIEGTLGAAVETTALRTTREYPCGCKASGPGDVPAYCPTHDPK